MTVFFDSEQLAFGSKVRLNRQVGKLQELGITHVIDARNYPSKKLAKFQTIHLNFKDDARPRPSWFYDRALKFYRAQLKTSYPGKLKCFLECFFQVGNLERDSSTFATRLVQAGVDLITVQHLLGHAKIAMTARYTHSPKRARVEAVERLSALYPSQPDAKRTRRVIGSENKKNVSRSI